MPQSMQLILVLITICNTQYTVLLKIPEQSYLVPHDSSVIKFSSTEGIANKPTIQTNDMNKNKYIFLVVLILF